MSVKQSTVAALILLFAFFYWCEARPQFGLGTLISGFDSSGNTTSLLTALALTHLQHKLDTLAQFEELLSLGANATQSLFLR